MANVQVTGSIRFSDGSSVPLLNAAMAEGTLTELQTDSGFTTVAQTLGSYAPGKTVVGGFIAAANNASYAYILRQGVILATIAVGATGAVNKGQMPTKNVRLMPGDSIQVMAVTASDREISVYAHCSDGTQQIFAATPSSGATNTLTSVITGNGLGETLQGKTITQVSVNGPSAANVAKISSAGGVVFLDAQGSPIGASHATVVAAAQPMPIAFNTRVQLNFALQCVTTS
tara:strand:- start:120 stop:809 length:690 start_codon:yes stop_codon:yes gene_type:complete